MGGRFLNRHLLVIDGFSRGQGDDSSAVLLDADTMIVNRAATIEGSMSIQGNVSATAAVLNTVTAGSGAITNFRLGSSVGNNLITAAWRTVYTWNMGAIAGVVGSTNSVIGVDVAMSGVAIGDAILATCIGSMDTFVNFAAACYSAAAVNLRAWYTGSVGALTPGNVPFKITAIKI